MEKEDLPVHLKRLTALFRERRFGEAMEYLDALPPETRASLGRALGDRFPDSPVEVVVEADPRQKVG